jgi:hypothetical protein
MKIEQRQWTEALGWTLPFTGNIADSFQMVLMFGAPAVLRQPYLLAAVRKNYPAAHIFGCSTAGEICGTVVSDDSLVVTAVHFEKTQVRSVQFDLAQNPDSFQAGQWIAQNLPRSVRDAATGLEEKLVHVLVLSDGLNVNGSDFVAGVLNHLPGGVTLTGGLAGDGASFGETLVCRDGVPEKNCIAALGLYGRGLMVGFGSMGGWDSFGPERLVTKSKGNVLYELDGHSALGLYKRYLGEHARGLPGTALLFPLSVNTVAGEAPLTRTVLSVDEEAQSLTFAGNVPEGAYARLMRVNVERLIDGAGEAGRTGHLAMGSRAPELALLISCVGRKLVLKQRVEEEIDAVRKAMGADAVLTGFYSYGEIAPFRPGARCELHNETMTGTVFSER